MTRIVAAIQVPAIKQFPVMRNHATPSRIRNESLILCDIQERIKIAQDPFLLISIRQVDQDLGGNRPDPVVIIPQGFNHVVPHVIRPAHRLIRYFEKFPEGFVLQLSIIRIDVVEVGANILIRHTSLESYMKYLISANLTCCIASMPSDLYTESNKVDGIKVS